MSFYRDLRAMARPLRRVLPKRPKLYNDEVFLSYVARKRAGLMQKADSFNVLALHASTADYAFCPMPHDRAYNLGLTSGDHHSTYFLYINVRDKMVNLGDIVVFALPWATGYCLSRSQERYRCVAYRHFFNIPLQDDGLYKQRYVTCIEKRCREIKIPAPQADYCGYDRKTYYGVNISAEDRVRTHLRENRREPDQMIWLQRLLDDASLSGHRVHIVIPPFRSDYRIEFEKAISPEEIFRKYYELNLGSHQVLNYYSSCKFGDECLGDTDHLNEEGARRFTHEIMQRISGNAT